MTSTATPPRAPTPRRAGPRLPAIPGPLQTLAAAWRTLRRMSTALLLLFALAASSVVATVVPQQPVTAQSVSDWESGAAGPGREVAAVLGSLGLFDVFGSWWFAALTVLLFTSLTGCLLPRYRAFYRTLRRPPAPGRNLSRLTASEFFPTSAEQGAVLDAAAAVLRHRRYRVRHVEAAGERPAQVAAERGSWREGGSLIFHTAFYLLLAGAVVGQAFGFTGQVAVAEGGAFADTRIAYDAVEPGRYFGLEDHRGFVVTLNDFDVSYFPNFTPRDFVSNVTITQAGQAPRTADVRVNHPLRHDGMTVYQTGFGMAPHVVVRAGEQVLFDERVLLGPAGGPNLWSGVAKVKFDDPERQLALEFALVPDAELDSDGQPRVGADPQPRNPVLVGNLYFGALGLERPLPATAFDRGEGPADTVMLRPGDRQPLAAGSLNVEFVGLDYWSGFQVSAARGRGLLLLAASLVLIGLIPSLYSYRRRIWVEVAPGDGNAGSRVTVAGVALQRKDTFAEEFPAVVGALRECLPAPAQPTDPSPQELRR